MELEIECPIELGFHDSFLLQATFDPDQQPYRLQVQNAANQKTKKKKNRNWVGMQNDKEQNQSEDIMNE
jgi:hypothetical protein